MHHHPPLPILTNRHGRRADTHTLEGIQNIKLMVFAGPKGHIVLRVRGSSSRDEDERRYIGTGEIKGYVQRFRPSQRYPIQRRIWNEMKSLPPTMKSKVLAYFSYMSGVKDTWLDVENQIREMQKGEKTEEQGENTEEQGEKTGEPTDKASKSTENDTNASAPAAADSPFFILPPNLVADGLCELHSKWEQTRKEIQEFAEYMETS
jgi:hypothetical protein